MKKRLVVLMTTAILAIGGISVAYAQGKDYISFNKVNDDISYQNTSDFSNMTKMMETANRQDMINMHESMMGR